jgi:rhodanese-related sulfurtransferase
VKTAGVKTDQNRRNFLLLPLLAGGVYLATRQDEQVRAPNVKEIMLEEAKALIAAGAVVLDVRERAAYEAKHIAGALLAPLDQLPRLAVGSLAYAKNMPFVVYCGDGSTLGPRGAQTLNTAGFNGAVNLKPGITGWAAAGLPIEHGPGKSA